MLPNIIPNNIKHRITPSEFRPYLLSESPAVAV